METKTIDQKTGYFGNYDGQFVPPHLEEKLNKLYETFLYYKDVSQLDGE